MGGVKSIRFLSIKLFLVVFKYSSSAAVSQMWFRKKPQRLQSPQYKRNRFTTRNQRMNLSHRKRITHAQITHACRRGFYHDKNNLLGEKETQEMTCCHQPPPPHSHQLTGRTLRSKVIAPVHVTLLGACGDADLHRHLTNR